MANGDADDEWVETEEGSEEGVQIDQYEITATPNDFNVMTIGSYLDVGAIVLPMFQRNFTWDKARASKLIESLILGLPVPQIFLYEEEKNKFLILDGQQRLMSIYFFTKGRFPKPHKRSFLRSLLIEQGSIPDEVLHDNEHFQNFNVALPKRDDQRKSPFEGLNYKTLSDYRTAFDLRPLRVVIIKQNEPREDNSSIYEIYDRLNTGGVNLKPQEIRANLYSSSFYRMIYGINQDDRWRKIIGKPDEDSYMRDIELVLRCFALLVWGDKYKPSMTRFLNEFSNHAKQNFDQPTVALLKDIFDVFLESLNGLPGNAFQNSQTRRFSIALFEAAFVGRCTALWDNKAAQELPSLENDDLQRLARNEEFVVFLQEGTTKQKNISGRLRIALEAL